VILGSIIAVLATLFTLLVTALYYAIRGLSVIKLEKLAELRYGVGGAKRLEFITRDTDGHAMALGALRTLSNIAITVSLVLVCGVVRIVEPPTGDISHGTPDLTVDLPRLAMAAMISFLVIYIFALVIPKSVADHAGERLILGCARFIRIVYTLALPVRIARVIDEGVRRLAGSHMISDAEVVEEELLSVVSEGEREGALGETEKEMIEAVVEFRSITVERVMTPRTEILGLEYTDDLETVRSFIERAGHSRIPVYEGDLDHIVGILYAKDLLHYLGRDTTAFRLRPLLRPAFFVPETNTLHDLLLELKRRKVHLAIVLDEFGGTTGLVTFEDVLEEIVGDIQDEFERPAETEPEIRVDVQGRWAELEARAYIDDANEALAPLGVRIPESEDYDTVGGYVLWVLGRIPEPGETLRRDDLCVRVLDAEPTRITRLRIEPAPKQDGDSEAPSDSRDQTSDQSPPGSRASAEEPLPEIRIADPAVARAKPA